jgi:hypothetical protein
LDLVSAGLVVVAGFLASLVTGAFFLSSFLATFGASFFGTSLVLVNSALAASALAAFFFLSSSKKLL